MNTRFAKLATTVTALSTTPLALAHGPHSADNTLYHYLSSPDHVLNMFGVAALTLLTIVWAVKRSAAPIKQKKP